MLGDRTRKVKTQSLSGPSKVLLTLFFQRLQPGKQQKIGLLQSRGWDRAEVRLREACGYMFELWVFGEWPLVITLFTLGCIPRTSVISTWSLQWCPKESSSHQRLLYLQRIFEMTEVSSHTDLLGPGTNGR